MNVTRTDVAWHLNECIACTMQNNGSAAFVGVVALALALLLLLACFIREIRWKLGLGVTVTGLGGLASVTNTLVTCR
jgi:hypothetical protein